MKRRFRVGSTSYVYPDDILPNVRQLAPLVDDVELVLFEVDDYGSNLPNTEAIAELDALAEANDLTYTVHLPLDLGFGNARSFDKARRAIEATRALDPFAFVLHLEGRALLNQPSLEAIKGWQTSAGEALAQVVTWVGDPQRVCVENVEAWDPRHFRNLVEHAGASRCVDIGHLWLQKCDPLEHLADSLPWTRVVHLHGVGSRDHQSLIYVSPEKLQAVADALLLEDYRGVLTLEVFSAEDFFTSLEALRAALARSGVA